MFTNRLPYLFVVTALLIITACAPKSTPQPVASTSLDQHLVGSWTSTVTKEDILRVVPDFQQQYLCDNSGTFVWKFDTNGKFTIDQTLLPGCTNVNPGHVEDTWSLDGNVVTFAKGTPDQESYEIAIDGDHLTFKVKSSNCPPCIATNTANPWTRVK